MSVLNVNMLSRAVILLLVGYALIFPFINQSLYSTKQKIVKEKPKKVVEQPLHDIDLPDFSSFTDVRAKKEAFFSFIEPAVIQENREILELRQRILNIQQSLASEQKINDKDANFLNELSRSYGVKSYQSTDEQISKLLLKVDIIPNALVLVQAANESAWGTSRFARIGLNFFGIWCYREGCGMIPNGRDDGARHEVAAFDSVEHAVERYLHNINTHSAYKVFRTIRHQLRESDHHLAPEILATGLLPYSERGFDYITEISDMIRHNQRYFTDEVSE